MQIHNVIFDFGGVLVRWRPQEIIESFYQDEALRRRVQESVFQHPDWVDWDRGTLSDEDAVERFAARMQRPVEEMRRLMDHVRHSLDALDDSHELVRTLSARGVPLYALSNMSRSTFAHIKARHAVFDHFRGIVISADIRLVKPDPRIFEHISRKFSLIPAETVFIDDHLPNVEAAARWGFGRSTSPMRPDAQTNCARSALKLSPGRYNAALFTFGSYTMTFMGQLRSAAAVCAMALLSAANRSGERPAIEDPGPRLLPHDARRFRNHRAERRHFPHETR